MSKVIEINAVPPVNVTLENIWTAELEAQEFIALDQLTTLPEDKVFNSGMASLGDPHVDEYDNGIGALREDHNPWNAKHVASIRLYGSNSYVYLLPGDKITIQAKTASEAVYYAMIKSDILKVTSDVVSEGSGDHPVDPVVEDEYLDRTTGIGDDGDPINFDSEEYTKEMLSV